MHDAVVVVADAVIVEHVRSAALEVVLLAGDDVVEEDADVLVAVGARLLVVEADGVTKLVYDHRFL